MNELGQVLFSSCLRKLQHFLSWIGGEGDEGKQERRAGLDKGVQNWGTWGKSTGGLKGHRTPCDVLFLALTATS